MRRRARDVIRAVRGVRARASARCRIKLLVIALGENTEKLTSLVTTGHGAVSECPAIAIGGLDFLDFRSFMHPAYIDLHGHPRYRALLAQWMDLINAERAKLGFGPLELNPNAGPGELPFQLQGQ